MTDDRRRSLRASGAGLCLRPNPSDQIKDPRGTMAAMVISVRKHSVGLAIALIAAVCVCTGLTGCRKTHVGKTAVPPRTTGPINDLTAIRAGDEISLSWTTPRKGMKKVFVKGFVGMRVCRLERTDSECIEAGHPILLPSGAAAKFAEELPALMTSGSPRVVYYAVEVLDHNGRSTGLTNRVPILVGAPPPPVEGLTAETSEKGVVLRWNPGPAGTEGETTIRLRRREGVPPVATEAMREGLVPFPGRPEVELSAADGAASVIDPDIHKGTTYQYRAERVFRIAADGQSLEIDGLFSPEVEVNLSNQPH